MDEKDNALDPKDNPFLRLSNDPEENAAALAMAKTAHLEAEIIDLPTSMGGPHLKSTNPKARMLAKLTLTEPAGRKSKYKP